MHNYLRSVGFSKYTKKIDMEAVLQRIIKEPDTKKVVEQEEGYFTQMDKYFGESFGISICGTYDEDGRFDMDYYYPFFYGIGITSYDKPAVERHAEKESYAGLCDDLRVGISIIFYVNNAADYKKSICTSAIKTNMTGVVMSGLSNEGKILLPINKTEKQRKADEQAVQQRIQLISAAKQGDEKAIESLTLDDLDTFTMIGKRLGSEDILSIVESYFMPRGIECDQYTILGEIKDYQLETNFLTKESIYLITVNCNEMIFRICINKDDLLGEPEIGRRIKANIWLQGTISFDS